MTIKEPEPEARTLLLSRPLSSNEEDIAFNGQRGQREQWLTSFGSAKDGESFPVAKFHEKATDFDWSF
jgi:hypothetical protein